MLRHLSFDQNADREIQDPVGTNNEFCVLPRNGESLQKRASKKSRRKTFFDFVASRQKWAFLQSYAAELDYFDSRYRGPEVHKASVLRAHVAAARLPEAFELLIPVNSAMNVIWNNVMEIVSGRVPSSERPKLFVDGREWNPT